MERCDSAPSPLEAGETGRVDRTGFSFDALWPPPLSFEVMSWNTQQRGALKLLPAPFWTSERLQQSLHDLGLLIGSILR